MVCVPPSSWEQCKDYSQYKGPREPKFLRERVQHFYSERVTQNWHGGHIMRGQHAHASHPYPINLDHNDYLSIANHSVISDAKINAIKEQSNDLLMSAIFLKGEDNPHRQFELAMAQHLNMEDALICQSGYVANVGLIQSIADEHTPVYIDAIAHMSLWEGIKSANADAVRFRHNDAEHLIRQIKQHGPGVIVVDSIYSTNGSLCPLAIIATIAEKYECVLVVDESHSLGTHGPNGSGLVAELNLTDKVHFITASLAKAFASRGGIITCSARNREYLIFESLPAIFSTAVLPYEVAGYQAALNVIQSADERRQCLHDNADFLRGKLLNLGYNVTDSQSQIISLEAGSEQNTIILRDALQSRGVMGSVFCAPATAVKRSLVRFCMNAAMTKPALERMSVICDVIREQVGMDNWNSTKRLHKQPVFDNIIPFPRKKRSHAQRTTDTILKQAI
tara:strand:- start:33836 stop:35185 length:1350 start_codon:yes stop_codon:yes gene_type:complete